MRAPRMLCVRLFGFVSYVIDGGDEIRLTDLRFPRVLAYLAVHADGHPTKAAVRSAVWGRVGAEDNLRRAIRELRDQHPRLAAHINDRGRTIGFEPSASLDVDVLTFADLKQAQRYEEALREVRGGFMADVPDNLCAWVDIERRRWNGQAARVCELLAARYWSEGRHESSIELVRQWERLRPHELAAAITLAEYLAAGGERNEALDKLNTFRAEHEALTQQEAGRLNATIARLHAGSRSQLPEPPPLVNGSGASRRQPPRRPDPTVVPGRPMIVDATARMSRPGARHRVCSRADDALRDEYRLAGWVQAHARRRGFYFAWCERASLELMHLTGGAEPKPESLVWTLIAALGEDESFAGHVRRRGGAFLTDDGNWDKLYRAGAATILEEYLAEVEKGSGHEMHRR